MPSVFFVMYLRENEGNHVHMNEFYAETFVIPRYRLVFKILILFLMKLHAVSRNRFTFLLVSLCEFWIILSHGGVAFNPLLSGGVFLVYFAKIP